MSEINRLTEQIVGAAIEVHRGKGPGLLESAYESVELKAIETVLPVLKAQVLTSFRETGHQVGLLINFHVPKLVDGVTRLLNDRTNPV